MRLKGIHTVKARLASGKTATYYYAWKGGPRLPGLPGSPEFMAAFHAAHAARKRPTGKILLKTIVEYKESAAFENLAAHTRRAYRRHLDIIQAEFGDLPLEALDDENMKGEFRRWRDGMRDTPRTADYVAGTLRRLIDFAIDNGDAHVNHAAKLKLLHKPERPDSIWTAADFDAFKLHASKQLWWAVSLAAFTGLRQGDLVTLTWGSYDGESFQVRTSKRNRLATIPAIPECQALMTEIKAVGRKHAVILPTAKTGQPWTSDGLRASFRKACKDAGVTRTFHDLRRTAATFLVVWGFSSAEVAMIMGWSEAEIEALKLRYVSRTAVVQSMLAKLKGGG